MDHLLYPCLQWDRTRHGQWEPALFTRPAAVPSSWELCVSQQAQGMQNPSCCWLARAVPAPAALCRLKENYQVPPTASQSTTITSQGTLSQLAGPRLGIQWLSQDPAMGRHSTPVPTRHPSPAASSTESSLAKMPPILLKAGSCSPYFSSSRFMLLISSSGAEQRQPCSAPALQPSTGAGAASRAPTALPD